ncbi:glycosyltransferase family 2 protein [Pseudodonghicola flavimaris]|uniref:Glycosyltransferase family A protein n=1 Tax=Pseudodonghicola flavimaris TaxID=3050036 RepID=A0ABT7F6B2_9RHOB|nr:glycosyltransferase family A protein [Pseudodonghicola flavimaris]MDK3020148.1 glycosyltransferase family A protein [Pseudodonghicola flavimaris]
MLRFTIIIPCYNAETTLARTLESLRFQTQPDWEALIVDDGSTDSTRAVAERFAAEDCRFRLLPNPGKGPASARNVALNAARGDLIAFCDADDLWEADKLQRMLEVFADPTVDAAFARVAFFDEAGSRTLSTVPAEAISVQMLLGENPVCTMSNLVVRRDVFRATGGFDCALVHNEDLEWLIRLCACGFRLIGVQHTLVHYRTSPTGLSSDLDKMRAGREAALATALRFGFRPDARAEAIHLRYLARRALRTGAPVREALLLACSGIGTSPAGFFSDLRRGGLTLAGALAAPLLPRALRQALFSH